MSRRRFLGRTGVAVGAAAGVYAVGHAVSAVEPSTVDGRQAVSLRVNGKDATVTVDPRSTLLDTVREELELTGTKKGCDRGQCGACTVHVNGRRVLSCLTLAVAMDRAEVRTVEGLADGENLHPVQQAFIDRDAFQCGFCTPGQIMSAVGLIEEGRAGSDEAIRENMSGNICRCSAYPNIVNAIKDARVEGRGR